MKELPSFDTTCATSLDERKTWMLPGDNYLVVLGAILTAIVSFMITTGLGQSFILRLAIAAMPFVFAGIYLALVVIGKPPHYATDWWAKLGKSKHFAVSPQPLTSRPKPRFLSDDAEWAS